jgi:hypothetical protein
MSLVRLRKWIIAMLLLAIGAALVWFITREQFGQTVFLLDGSRLTLRSVTIGRHHVFRYGHRLEDIFYPFFPSAIRKKVRPRIVNYVSLQEDEIAFWFETASSTTPYAVSFFDKHGLESAMMNAPGYGITENGTNHFDGWFVTDYPRRGEKIGVRIYQRANFASEFSCVGEFVVSNPLRKKFPARIPGTLPATWRLDGLEVQLVKFETGLNSKEAGLDPVLAMTKACSRVTLRFLENSQPTRNWTVTSLEISALGNKPRIVGDFEKTGQNNEEQISFQGALWADEPAWKLRAELSRTSNFAGDQLWSVGRIPIPAPGERVEVNARTNLQGAELQFDDIKMARRTERTAFLHLRVPLEKDLGVALADIKDDQKRNLHHLCNVTEGYGAGGATPKEQLYEFKIDLPDNARSLDAIFAVSRRKDVEFLARPSWNTGRTNR